MSCFAGERWRLESSLRARGQIWVLKIHDRTSWQKYMTENTWQKINPVVFREGIRHTGNVDVGRCGVHWSWCSRSAAGWCDAFRETKKKHYITRKNKNARPELECRWRLLTWHWILVVVLEPAEETIDCREHLRAIPKAIWSDGYELYPTKQNTKGKHLQMHDIRYMGVVPCFGRLMSVTLVSL